MTNTDKKITTLIFDCFGVVSSPVLGSWYKINSKKYGFTDDNIQNVFHKYDLGEYSEDDIVDYFSSYEEIKSTKKEIREEIDRYLKLDEKLFKKIMEYKANGYKLVLLSNANSSFFNRKVFPAYPEIKLFLMKL